MWGTDLKLQRAMKTSTDSCKARDLWVTHFVVLQNVNKIALAFTSKEIGMYPCMYSYLFFLENFCRVLFLLKPQVQDISPVLLINYLVSFFNQCDVVIIIMMMYIGLKSYPKDSRLPRVHSRKFNLDLEPRD